MSKIIKKNKKKNGYALLELLFYISLFAVLTIVVIDAMITMARSFKETTIQAELVQSGTIMERMSREIRQASSIDATSTSTDLKLNTTSGADTAIEFKLSGSNIQLLENNVFTGDLNTPIQLLENNVFTGDLNTPIELLENNVFTGNLNTPNIVVTNLTFTQITTTKSKAIKISLTLKANDDMSGRLVDFYDTVVLRGSY